MTKLTATKALRVSPNAKKGKGSLKMYYHYQVTIPPILIKRLSWTKNTPLHVSLSGETIRITKLQSKDATIPDYRTFRGQAFRNLRRGPLENEAE